MSYTNLSKLWGEMVLSNEITIDEVPNFIKEEVIAYVANANKRSTKN